MNFSIFINLNFNESKNASDKNPEIINKIVEENGENTLKTSGFWDLTGSSIYIDDNNPNYNWILTEATKPWCNYVGGAYIIENVTVDEILIVDSNVDFIIRNNTIYNGGSGIYLSNVNNGILINNSIVNNDSGISLESVNNVLITQNKINYNGGGISLKGYSTSCTNNVISNNTINYNDFDGILLTNDNYPSINNNISGNVIKYNSRNGINSYIESDTNIISGNDISNNAANGINLLQSEDNIVLENNINDNGEYGIYIHGFGSNDNEISRNNITNNDLYGIYINSNGQSNTIYNNNFTGNAVNALDDGSSNQWDNGSLGNYWDDYNGNDTDDDGIGDTPYDVPPGGGSKDYYPIWDDGDGVIPVIGIVSPNTNQIVGVKAPNFEIIVTDRYTINTTWYTIDGGATNYTFSGNIGEVNQIAWDEKVTEQVTIEFYANDTKGYWGTNQVNIKKDIITPEVLINTPAPNQLLGINIPNFNVYINDANLHKMWYSLNGSLNVTFTTNTTFNPTVWGNIDNGSFSMKFYANDTAGNEASNEMIVEKDAFLPAIDIKSPLYNKLVGKQAPNFTVEISDINLNKTCIV